MVSEPVTMASADQASSLPVPDPVGSSDSNELNTNPYCLKSEPVTMASADQASSLPVPDPVGSSDSNELNTNPYCLKSVATTGAMEHNVLKCPISQEQCQQLMFFLKSQTLDRSQAGSPHQAANVVATGLHSQAMVQHPLMPNFTDFLVFPKPVLDCEPDPIFDNTEHLDFVNSTPLDNSTPIVPSESSLSIPSPIVNPSSSSHIEHITSDLPSTTSPPTDLSSSGSQPALRRSSSFKWTQWQRKLHAQSSKHDTRMVTYNDTNTNGLGVLEERSIHIDLIPCLLLQRWVGSTESVQGNRDNKLNHVLVYVLNEDKVAEKVHKFPESHASSV
nr:hypothetical protein CFP56_45125 [Quercus suber]